MDGPLRVASEVAAGLMHRGARGVALVGSYARGEAHSHSDLDVVAMGSGEPRLVVRAGLLVSESWLSASDAKRMWRDVAYVGQVVPAWRSAVPIVDPAGEVEALKQRAHDWTWETLGDAPERWVADEFPGYGEEVLRLVGHVLSERLLAAAVMRNVCANRMAFTLAVHHRLLYGTENRLWDAVAERMGPQWLHRQRSAFGVDTSFVDSCWAAADLFAMTAAVVGGVLNDEQQEVVAMAVRTTTDAQR